MPDDARGAGGPVLRFSVLRDPTLNAFALPNGRIYIHSGLLARLDNEAQLAMIVGREMTYVINRHALSVTREGQSQQQSAASIGIAAAGSGASAGDHLGTAALSPTANALLRARPAARHPRRDGRPRTRSRARGGRGWDGEPGPSRLRPEGGAAGVRSAGQPVQSRGKPRDLLSRQPCSAGRAGREHRRAHQGTLRHGRGRFRHREEHPRVRLRMRSLVRENARLEIQAGRFTLAREQLDRVLAVTPGDAVAELYYGDLHRLESQRSRDAADRPTRRAGRWSAMSAPPGSIRALPIPSGSWGFSTTSKRRRRGAGGLSELPGAQARRARCAADQGLSDRFSPTNPHHSRTLAA